MKKEVVARVAKVLSWGALALAVGCHLWAANRGLEMTDEASYLLIALDPWNTWGHGTFHGFLLRPLYLLGGSSVVGMRWIGYAAVLMAAWRLAGGIRIRRGDGDKTLASLGVPVLMVAAMTVYCGGIRTPCYNWMILLGAMLAWSGWLRCGFDRLGPVEMGLGLTIAVVGKWGAALVLLILFAILSFSSRRDAPGATAKDWQTVLLTFLFSISCFALYAEGNGIRDTLHAGILIAKTTGSHGWFILPKYGGEILYYLYRVARAYFWLLPAIVIFWWLAKRTPQKWTPEKMATILFFAGLSLAAFRGWWRGGIEQFGKESVLAGCWLLGVAWTVWAVRRRTEDGGRRAEDRRQRSVVGSRWAVSGGRSLMVWGLVLTPFLCGVGTNTSIADYAGQGTVFFVAAGILMFGMVPATVVRGVAVVALTGLCLLQASRVSSALLGMYRLGSIFDQTEILASGPEAGHLRVDPKTLTQIESIRAILQKKGVAGPIPVVGVDSLCGWIYLSGASSPGVPWFFRDQPEYLRQVLATLKPQTFQSCWIWIRSSSQISNPAGWWPTHPAPTALRKVGEIPFLTDRGDETLALFAPQP